MNHNYPPSLTIQLDAYSKQAIKKIQNSIKAAGLIAVFTSTADIMTLVKDKPTKTIKRIYKKDWNDFIARIKGLKGLSNNTAIRIAYEAQNKYLGMSGENNQNLYFFWKGVLNAFTK